MYPSRLYPSLLLLLVLAACRGAGFDEAAHREDVEAWRRDRIAALKAPDGWLTLVGLYWLHEGNNTIGSAAYNELLFPAGTPAHIGRIYLTDGVARLYAAPGAGLLHDGQPVDSLTMAPDTAGTPTVVSLGSLQWHLIARDGQIGVRLRDVESAAAAALDSIASYPIDPAWRITGRFVPYRPARKITVPTILGTVSEQTTAGALAFEVNGLTHRLDVIGEPGDSTFFVIFADPTNGNETYDAGRYLYVDAPDEEGRVVIDFNKAYNPPCVFTPYATCPFPPRQNRLRLLVEAGEKKYEGPAHL
jgi:uncharacterized protein (DUF1684 family)